MTTRRLSVIPALFAAATAGVVSSATQPAFAIRPFVTDDARVVGEKLAQLETWVLVDRFVLEHNALAAVGPTSWLEVTAGVVNGATHTGPRRGYSITGPILQGKALLLPARNNGRPGLAFAAGALAPIGHGSFKPPGWGGFAYFAMTESIGEEKLLIHANIGLAAGDNGNLRSREGFAALPPERVSFLVTAGVGAQLHVVRGLHAVAEVYYGDPYDPRTGFPASQVGFRYIFSDRVQMDGTMGTTLREVGDAGGHLATEQWGTLGLRVVSPELW